MSKLLNKHQPVLVAEVLEYLAPAIGESYLDATAGWGGHAAAVLERTQAPEHAVLVDRDKTAINALKKQFGTSLDIKHQDFYSAANELKAQRRQFDLILADLGVSSVHLDNAKRGFSLKKPGPLDMRMDKTQTLTAEHIVNSYSQAELADILKRWGEEPKAAQIARRIIAARPVKTTTELAKIVSAVWPGHSRHHPATRTFQALRIAVNDELELLKKALPVWVDLLALNGRLVVISFHSLEDRAVKQALAHYSGNRYDAVLKSLTPSPVMAEDEEIVNNPRARSARLRAVVKINN